ncbi:pyruvate ferredoxin oxidoreductase [candidate division KSB1 bacterium]|nr:pyruvate ferredoxin oxidoreductase [candidate division KSB1 bacterium]
MKKVLTGNFAAAYGATAAKVNVISAYPITPQTTIVEILSEIVADGELNAEFVKVESEHSALACCIGAQATGARTFTATSSQGLALMHELIHWAARARLPIIMVNVNRAMAPGWSIWADATDSISQRDTGWIQMYCENNQEVFDTVLMSYKISESESVMLPALINLDAFFLSHTSQVVDLYNEARIDQFLSKYDPKIKLDVDDPHAFGALTSPEHYYEFSYKMHEAQINAIRVIKEVGQEFGKIFGRTYDLTESYRCDDAELILVSYGTIAGTAKEAVDQMRNSGIVVGVLKIRYFRPFPTEDVIKALHPAKKVGVIDRAVSYGQSGPFFNEIRSTLYHESTPLYGFIAGLGGRDVSTHDIENMVDIMQNDPAQDLIWIGVKNVD